MVMRRANKSNNSLPLLFSKSCDNFLPNTPYDKDSTRIPSISLLKSVNTKGKGVGKCPSYFAAGAGAEESYRCRDYV